MTVIGATSI